MLVTWLQSETLEMTCAPQRSANISVLVACAVVVGATGCGSASSTQDESTDATTTVASPASVTIEADGTAVEGFRRLQVYRIEDVLIAKFLDNRLDDSAGDIGDEFSRLTNDSDAKSIILNFESVQFFSDTPLEKLMATKAECDTKGKQLILCGLHGDIEQVFKIMHFDHIFTIATNLDSALQRARS